MKPLKTLVVGLGSPHGDDQAGWMVVDLLSSNLEESETILRKANSPAQLLNWLGGSERLVICDACTGLGAIGDIKRWEWPAAEILQASWSGTHDLSLPDVLRVAEGLDQLPPNVVVRAIEIREHNPFAMISRELKLALPTLTNAVRADMEQGITIENNDA